MRSFSHFSSHADFLLAEDCRLRKRRYFVVFTEDVEKWDGVQIPAPINAHWKELSMQAKQVALSS